MRKQPFNQEWSFHLDDLNGPRWGLPEVSKWRTVDLPHDWSIELDRDPNNVSGDSGGYFQMGRGWYQKTFSIPKEWAGKVVFIEFEGVYMNAEVWLNDNLLGRHPYGYTSFGFELTPNLDWDAPNHLKVFVDNGHQLNSRWYSGSGIYRPVWLMVADPVHVAHWGVSVTTADVTAESALVDVKTKVDVQMDSDPKVTLRTRIIGPNGEDVGKTTTTEDIEGNSQYEFKQEIQVASPQLWSPESPSLYRLETDVLVGGDVTDTQATTFGIRSLAFSAENGFYLNGEPVLLKGGCVHHDNGILGAASYARSEERKVEIHKASGFNAIRCAHNPPAPAFLDACDRLGMLVIDEAFDCWREGKNHGDYHVVFDDWWQRDIEAMVTRDRNHPSIIIWSIGNEVLERDGRGGGFEISRLLAEHIRSLDPTRPVTAAICSSWSGGDWEKMDGSFATLDVGGYNYQWEHYRSDHERLPDRIMMGTESFPLEAFENWMRVVEEPYIIGDFVWTSLDYLGESGIGRVHFDGDSAPFLGGYPWHQANCGDLDLCGFKRPQSYYRDILWHESPHLYIAVHPPAPEGKIATISRWGWPDVWPDWNWSRREGEMFKVDVYANCDQVELILNQISLGIKPCTREEKFTVSFEVAYQPGELCAVGYRNGKPVAEHMLMTTRAPARIHLTADRGEIQAGDDLSYVTVEVKDHEGRVHPKGDQEITFSIHGPGKILAVGSSNPVSGESYVGDQRRVHRGRALVVVKSIGETGEIRLRAQGDGLDGAEVIIKAV